MLTGSAESGVDEELFLAFAARLVRVDAAAFVDWVCRGEVRTPRAGVFVTVAGGFVYLFFCLVAVGARGGFSLPVPPQGATIIDNERGVDVCEEWGG